MLWERVRERSWLDGGSGGKWVCDGGLVERGGRGRVGRRMIASSVGVSEGGSERVGSWRERRVRVLSYWDGRGRGRSGSVMAGGRKGWNGPGPGLGDGVSERRA